MLYKGRLRYSLDSVAAVAVVRLILVHKPVVVANAVLKFLFVDSHNNGKLTEIWGKSNILLSRHRVYTADAERGLVQISFLSPSTF